MMVGYIGPGAGFVFTGTFLALLAALASGLVSLFVLPVRMIRRATVSRKAFERAKVKKMIFLGLDGLDPKLCDKYMAEGKLPNLKKLSEQGSYTRLRTTFPCLSPVAWSCFATGGNPAKHNIFGFLSRNLKTYAPELSSSRVRPPEPMEFLGLKLPFGKPRLELKRKSVPFWRILGQHDIHATILRVPITFPPEKFNGHALAAMCTPDLRGTQGSFSFYSTGVSEKSTDQGLRLPLKSVETGASVGTGVMNGEVLGPSDPKTGEPMTIPFTIEPVPAKKLKGPNPTPQWDFVCQNVRTRLAPGAYSKWIQLKFKKGLGGAKGIVRLLITGTAPEFEVYMSPINIDPGSPSLPISHPKSYAIYLAKLMGSYATLGLAEDTWAMNERVLDEEAFLQQAWLNHDEREKMFFNALDKQTRGVVACVFDASDRVQHMFYRCFQEDHPGNEGRDVEGYKDVIEKLYMKMDDLVGRTQAKYVDEDTMFVVLSDHGFENFVRGVNLNAWLRENGYMVLKDGKKASGDYFADVDWEQTRAYAVGLGGIYINRKGREGQGSVPKDEVVALRQEIADKLSGLRDPSRDETAISRIQITSELYRGPYIDAGPDLLVGYNKGYRASWSAATGGVTEHVFEDNNKAWGGDHCIAPEYVPGVLFTNRKIEAENPGIEDMAPTALKLFGIDPPKHMDGVAIL